MKKQRKPMKQTLPLIEWFRTGDNADYCKLIAHQLRTRGEVLRNAGERAAAQENETIAAIIETGDFHWMY